METSTKKSINRWTAANLAIYPIMLGLMHPLIAHGFTGRHDKSLTGAQLAMHTLSISLFLACLAIAQNSVFPQMHKRKIVLAAVLMPTVPMAAFWLGYYTLYIPFDILFMFLSIALINSLLYRDTVRLPGKWMWQNVRLYLLGALAGIVAGLGAYLLFLKDIDGLSREIFTWLLISIPASLVISLAARPVLRRQLLTAEEYNQGVPECTVAL